MNKQFISHAAKIFAVAAITFGIYARLAGLGTWPLATDEFYLYRAISQFIENGLPAFGCGGYYTRGVLLQLAYIPVMLTSIDIEYGMRIVPAVFGVLSLYGSYLVARLVGGPTVAAISVVILSLSMWHIEISRFARMYAPYQALFLFYGFFLIQFVRSGRTRDFVALAALSIAAPLVWEGGAFLAIVNFSILFFRRSFNDWRSLLLLVGVLIFAVFAVITDFRQIGDVPPFPADYVVDESSRATIDLPRLLIGLLGWASAFPIVIITLASIGAFYRIPRTAEPSDRITTLIALLVITTLLALNQIALAAMATAAFRLADWLRKDALWSEKSPGAILWLFALASTAWILAGVLNAEPSLSVKAILKALIDFPNILDSVVRPWWASMPFYSTYLLASAALLVLHRILFRQKNHNNLDVLLFILITCFSLTGVASTLFYVSRYTYYLYPFVVIASVISLRMLIVHSRLSEDNRLFLASGCALLVFAVGEDFRPLRSVAIDDYATNFRVGERAGLVSHYYRRMDLVSAAEEIARLKTEGDLVLTTVVESTPYLQGVDYIYLDRTDPRYVGQACLRGTTERWTNLPLIGSLGEVQSLTGQQDTWILVRNFPDQTKNWENKLLTLGTAKSIYVTPDDNIRVILIAGNK